jgi:hypothetical protein
MMATSKKRKRNREIGFEKAMRLQAKSQLQQKGTLKPRREWHAACGLEFGGWSSPLPSLSIGGRLPMFCRYRVRMNTVRNACDNGALSPVARDISLNSVGVVNLKGTT